VISYRHHVVSLVAVFLALAVGVALGGGPLSELGRDDTPASASTRADQQQARRQVGFGDQFAAAAAPRLYGNGLRNHPVAILTLPGAHRDVVSALTAQVQQAGGTVTGTFQAERSLVAASEKALVDTLGSQLMTQLGDDVVPADSSTYDRMGRLVGLAVSGSQVSADQADSLRQSLAGADLVTSPDSAARAPLVLVVLGRDGVDPAILSGLFSGLDAVATGVVVAGGADSGEDGDLRALRAEPAANHVATVDGVETGVGQVTTVLALIRALEVPGGSFGASGSDGAVPLG